MNKSTKIMSWVLGFFVVAVVVLGVGAGMMGNGDKSGSFESFENSVSSSNSESPF